MSITLLSLGLHCLQRHTWFQMCQLCHSLILRRWKNAGIVFFLNNIYMETVSTTKAKVPGTNLAVMVEYMSFIGMLKC